MKQQTPSSRPFVAWVTGLTDRYQGDPFFKVHVQIILVQVVLAICVGIFLYMTYQYLDRTSFAVLNAQLEAMQKFGDTGLAGTIAQNRRIFVFTMLFVGFVLLTTLFTILISHISLRPSRNTFAFQKRFIGNIAHEIRTPLAIIKTSTEVALFDPKLPKDIRETMEGTLVELNRISETINNLLSFDSLTHPKAMHFEPVELSEIARKVVARHLEFAKSRGITLTCEAVDGAIVNGNATALDQLLTNLVKNAINYTPQDQNGMVTVEIDRTMSDAVSVCVIDTGIGIAQKDLYHIFEPFFRADTSRARGIGTGTSGLGLAIVNEIVRVHHGTITLRSAVGHGTTVKITFPPYKDMSQELPLLSASGSPHEATLDFS